MINLRECDKGGILGMPESDVIRILDVRRLRADPDPTFTPTRRLWRSPQRHSEIPQRHSEIPQRHSEISQRHSSTVCYLLLIITSLWHAKYSSFVTLLLNLRSKGRIRDLHHLPQRVKLSKMIPRSQNCSKKLIFCY